MKTKVTIQLDVRIVSRLKRLCIKRGVYKPYTVILEDFITRTVKDLGADFLRDDDVFNDPYDDYDDVPNAIKDGGIE